MQIYAVGNKVVWSRPPFPLPSDMRETPLDAPFTADEIKQIGWAVKEEQFADYLQRRNHKALAIGRTNLWFLSNVPTPAEAAKLATERCSERAQAPCLLVSVDGLPTQRLPKTHHVTRPFTLAGETDMTAADKERIGGIYSGKDWRALARGSEPRWYAVNGMNSEEEAVAEVLKVCRQTEKVCSLHAIGNFRVGEKRE